MQNPDNDLTKAFYRIGDVSELLGVPANTLRYWEQEFPEVKPRRHGGGHRYYTPADVRMLRKIHYLVKEKGLRIDAAKEQLRANAANLDRRFEVMEILTDTRDDLKRMLAALTKRR